ncbi:transposase [Candidatus Riflebacteria bacterium]
MSRKARSFIIGEGNYYHVYSRFSCHRYLLRNRAGKKIFLQLLSRYCKKYNVLIHGYCLMDNHFHILCSIGEGGNLSKAFGKVKELYSRWYHARNEKSDGPLWKERFRSSLIEDDYSALNVLRYIENNPVRAKLSSVPWDYTFSSNRFYIMDKYDSILTPLPSLMGLSTNSRKRKEIYLSFFDLKKDDSKKLTNYPWFHSPFLGSETFIEKKLYWLKEKICQRLRWKKNCVSGYFFGLHPNGAA